MGGGIGTLDIFTAIFRGEPDEQYRIGISVEGMLL